MAYSLSIGVISTLIAAAFVIVRLIVPNSFALVLVHFIRDQESAATWGFIQKSLIRTEWPILLRADSFANGAIQGRVRMVNSLQIILTALIAIAAVLTPAGLYDDVMLSKSTVQSTFVKPVDTSAYALATQKHNERPWRMCSGYYFPNETLLMDVQCPGDTQQYTVTHNSSGYFQAWEGVVHNVSVHLSRAEIFQSGLQDMEPSVSSFFDIKSRRIQRSAGDSYSRNDGYLPQSTFTFVQNPASTFDTDYVAIDGLVVDLKNGGIGFRNHTVPNNDASLGALWTEDLLFLEPDVACVDLNISFAWTVPLFDGNYSSTKIYPISIIDEGGFANFDTAEKPLWKPVQQQTLDLHDRAYTNAWWTIYQTMRSPEMNLSNPQTGEPDPGRSHVGSKIDGNDATSGPKVQLYDGIQLSPPKDFLLRTSFTYNDTFDMSASRPFYNLTNNCTGWNENDKTSIDSIPVYCDILVAAATLMDGTRYDVPEEGMILKRKIYSFAFTLKSSIKTVTFGYNSTQDVSLQGLKILDIKPKQYTSEKDYPIWAMETPPLLNGNFKPLWGLVSEQYANLPNLTTIRAPHLYLNYWPNTIDGLKAGWSSKYYLPASEGLSTLYASSTSLSYGLEPSDVSFAVSGQNSPALFWRYQKYSLNATSAAMIPKTILTSLSANFFTGSRGWLSESIVPPPFRNLTGNTSQRAVPTLVYQRHVRYRWPYGIPAFLCAATLLPLILAASGAAANGAIRRLSTYLRSLSPGRLLVALDPSEEVSYAETYLTWARVQGQKRVRLWLWGWRAPRMSDSTFDPRPFDSKYDSPAAAAAAAHYPMTDLNLNTINMGGKKAHIVTRDTASATSAAESDYSVQRPFLASGPYKSPT